MESLLINTRPIAFGLIGFAFAYYNHMKTKKEWNKRPPKLPSHLLIRVVLACLAFAIVAFIVSMFLTTSLTFTLINTVFLVALFLLYLSKVLVDMKRFYSKPKTRLY